MFDNISKLAMNSKTGSAEDADRDGWVIEPKYDGIRLLLHVTEDGVESYARSGKSKTGKVPAIEAEVLENFPVGTWIDGEAVAFNDDGTQDWGGAQSVLGSSATKVIDRSKIRFVIFDLLALDGKDARGLALSDRRELLELIFSNGNFNLCVLSDQEPTSSAAHETNLERGFEGSMVKRLSAAYASGKRSDTSLKLKATDTVDAVVTGFSPATPGSWIDQAGLVGAIEFTHYLNGEAIDGKCSGMTTEERQMLTRFGHAGMVIEVSYMTRMPGTGKLRHPQFKRVRTDKSPDECRA